MRISSFRRDICAFGFSNLQISEICQWYPYCILITFAVHKHIFQGSNTLPLRRNTYLIRKVETYRESWRIRNQRELVPVSWYQCSGNSPLGCMTEPLLKIIWNNSGWWDRQNGALWTLFSIGEDQSQPLVPERILQTARISGLSCRKGRTNMTRNWWSFVVFGSMGSCLHPSLGLCPNLCWL